MKSKILESKSSESDLKLQSSAKRNETMEKNESKTPILNQSISSINTSSICDNNNESSAMLSQVLDASFNAQNIQDWWQQVLQKKEAAIQAGYNGVKTSEFEVY